MHPRASHGPARISFFITYYPHAGLGPGLHRHPYDETSFVEEGTVLLEIGDEKAEAGQGDIAVVPANTPHKFTSVGPDTARVLCIHASPRLIRESLE